MNSDPLVTVLMNCYNSEKFLKEALTSVVEQSYANWQLLFVDNHSTDSSSKILEEFLPDSRIVYLKTPTHMDLGEAREFAMDYCGGEYLAFLDTDDRWVPHKLEEQVKLFERESEVVFCYSSFYIMDGEGKTTGQTDLEYRKGNLFGRNLVRNEICFQTAMVRKNTLDRIKRPWFDPNLQYGPDFDLFMRVFAEGTAVCLPEKLAHSRKTPDSLTKKLVHRWGIEREYTYNHLEKSGAVEKFSTKEQQVQAKKTIEIAKLSYHLKVHDYQQARKLLKNHKSHSLRFFALYYLSFFPGLLRSLREFYARRKTSKQWFE